jgi:hypothetical protein
MSSKIDFSAQFGGKKAAALVLPHFRLLKDVAKEREVRGFPFPELAFILRVDGDVNTYGLSGPGNIDVDSRGEYVSVDIGLQEIDLRRDDLSIFIGDAIRSSVALLVGSGDRHLANFDTQLLQDTLDAICSDYKALAKQLP